MKLIVGLGNHGVQYENTRHNAGFIVLDHFAETHEIKIDKVDFHSLYGVTTINNETVFLLKPKTFMNLSGIAVKEIVDYYKIRSDDILVIYDDYDLNLSLLRIKKGSSTSNHNGIKSVQSALMKDDFFRLRVGIGPKDPNLPTTSYVLGKFSKSERELLNDSLNSTDQLIIDFMTKSLQELSQKYNEKNH